MYIFASNGSGIYNTSIKVIIQICIESNLRHRVVGNANPIKLGKCFQFLNDWYGFEKGNNQYGYEKNSHPKITQEQLASQMDMDVRTLQNYKMLADMIPELDELVTTGIVTKTTALAIMRNLSEDSLKFI